MEITEGIHRVDGVNANAYLVIEDEELTVIDTGMPRNANKILRYIESIGHQQSSVSKIVLTHCHMDHAGSAKALKLHTNAKIAIHLEDADFVAGKKAFPKSKDIPGILYRIFSPFFKARLVTPDIMLKDKDVVGRLTVIHTPGHTPGSISLYDPERSMLFVGDALSFVQGELRTPNFVADIKQETKSIEKILQLDFDTMLCGHGDPLKPDAHKKVRHFLDTSCSRLGS